MKYTIKGETRKTDDYVLVDWKNGVDATLTANADIATLAVARKMIDAAYFKAYTTATPAERVALKEILDDINQSYYEEV